MDSVAPDPRDRNLTHDERLRAAGLEVRARVTDQESLWGFHGCRRVYAEGEALRLFCGEK